LGRTSMPSDELQRLRESIAQAPDNRNLSLAEIRSTFLKLGKSFPLPPDVSMEPITGGELRGFRFTPSQPAERKGILYLHGGGYVLGISPLHRVLCASLSRISGMPVWLPDFPLAPEHPFPAALEQVLAAYRLLIARGCDPAGAAVAGDSAGGGLTVALLTALRDAGDPLPGAAACISPWVDLTCSSESYATRAARDPLVRLEEVLRFARYYLADTDPRHPLASPLFADLTGLPPLLIQVGGDEVLLDDAVRLDRRAREQGVSCTLDIWEELIHVWPLFAPMLKEGRDALERMGAYLREHTG